MNPTPESLMSAAVKTEHALSEALEFYANGDMWLDQNFPHGDYLSHAYVDKGDEARKALAHYRTILKPYE